jgi:GDPmannose 4,6-dehydratase
MSVDKTVLITGITGQDGSYLSDLLVSKGYKVIGLVRRTVASNDEKYRNISHLLNNKNFILESGDITDSSSIWRLIDKYRPSEVYNLAAQSHVGESYHSPISTAEIDAIGPLHILEAIRNIDKSIRFYQASTSEMFGDLPGPQSEITPFSPVSPYACAKVFAHNMTATYRKSYGMYSCSGILFNHESPRRGENFVTRKITKAAARIKLGKQDVLELGNIDTFRDWGFAGDYVEAMWLMLQQDKAEDFVISTGVTHTVREFVELVFAFAGLDINTHMRINPAFFRPHDVPHLLGDSTKARNILGWTPKADLKQLAYMMYQQDLNNELNK